MITFPPCKINLGLNILRRRDDGYHDIETCYYPVPWTDVLEIIRSDAFHFGVSGLPIPGTAAENLCVRAYEILQEDFKIGPVKMHLHKTIPMGAGLGGGSSDAAHALHLLNQLFNLGLSNERLVKYAASLGSDCAFFISGKPAFATGRGERLREIKVGFNNEFLVILVPEIHIATATAYAGVTPAQPAVSCDRIVSEIPVREWKNILKNDFEGSVFRQHPLIGRIKQSLYDAGASYAGMSGSGAAVFGIFDRPVQLPEELRRYQSWSGAIVGKS